MQNHHSRHHRAPSTNQVNNTQPKLSPTPLNTSISHSFSLPLSRGEMIIIIFRVGGVKVLYFCFPPRRRKRSAITKIWPRESRRYYMSFRKKKNGQQHQQQTTTTTTTTQQKRRREEEKNIPLKDFFLTSITFPKANWCRREEETGVFSTHFMFEEKDADGWTAVAPAAATSLAAAFSHFLK